MPPRIELAKRYAHGRAPATHKRASIVGELAGRMIARGLTNALARGGVLKSPLMNDRGDHNETIRPNVPAQPRPVTIREIEREGRTIRIHEPHPDGEPEGVRQQYGEVNVTSGHTGDIFAEVSRILEVLDRDDSDPQKVELVKRRDELRKQPAPVLEAEQKLAEARAAN